MQVEEWASEYPLSVSLHDLEPFEIAEVAEEAWDAATKEATKAAQEEIDQLKQERDEIK